MTTNTVFEIQNDDNVLRASPRDFLHKGGLGTFFYEKLSSGGSHIAQIDVETGEKQTYEELFKKCVRTAIAMRSKGLKKGDIVTICSSNHLDTCVPYIASYFLGVLPANTDPNISLEDTVFMLKQVKPKMIFVSTNAVNLMEDALKEMKHDAEIVIFGETSDHTSFGQFLEASEEEKDFKPVDISNLKETCAILFSSGTTGMPKGICVHHRGLLAQIIPSDKNVKLGVLYSTSSAYWISYTMLLLNCVEKHTARLVLRSFDVEKFWQIIQEYKVNCAVVSPTEIATICQTGRPDGIDATRLKFVGFVGSSFSKEQMATARQIFPNTLVVSGYGVTELGGGATGYQLTNPKDIQFMMQKPISTGRPLPGFAYKIVNVVTEKILGPNQEGELRIKTENQMNGYYGIDSSDQWDSDGFLKTGDVAYYDEDYCFFIVDRIKEMLKYRGWQIAPAKLEAILMNHPDVKSVIVIGLPHPVDCDHPMALVVLRDSSKGKITEKEVEMYVQERVDDKQRLRGGVKFVDKLYMTPTGKYKRRFMKNLVLEGKKF